jgi:hypothetical protein
VAGGEADDAATAGFGFGKEEIGDFGFWILDFGLIFGGEKGGEVVVEDEGAGVGWIVEAAGSFVAGAKVAGGVVGGEMFGGGFFYLAEPGALGAVGGDQNPLGR